jgi:hypothetical protein
MDVGGAAFVFTFCFEVWNLGPKINPYPLLPPQKGISLYPIVPETTFPYKKTSIFMDLLLREDSFYPTISLISH